MPTQTNAPARAGGEDSHPAPSTAGARKAPPTAFVYDNGEIMLELPSARAAEEARRRFVEGLRRLRGHGVGGDEKR
jgi:hypothetical protein